MTVDGPDFRQSWLWRHAFQTPRSDSSTDEQEYFKKEYLSVRGRAEQLVSRIAADMPGLTVHDISHTDALWDIALLVAEGAVTVNPAEAFVFGCGVLLHDAAMSVSAYPNGLSDIQNTVAWKDAVSRLALAMEESGGESFDRADPPESIVMEALPDVLRQLHAQHAEVLAEQAWDTPEDSKVHLVEDPELRHFYGPTIGQIAHSHWWSIQRVEQELSEELGALASRTHNCVDRLKLAPARNVSRHRRRTRLTRPGRRNLALAVFFRSRRAPPASRESPSPRPSCGRASAF